MDLRHCIFSILFILMNQTASISLDVLYNQYNYENKQLLFKYKGFVHKWVNWIIQQSSIAKCEAEIAYW